MEQKIDLGEIPTVVIGRHSDKHRHEHMLAFTKSNGLNAEFPDGVTATPNFVGCGLSHIRACANEALPTPFLLLEDDVDATSEMTTKFKIPSDADIIFLGVTSYGLAPDLEGRALEHAAITEDYSDTYARVHNMLGAHALLFVTEKGRAAYVDASTEFITRRFRPHDIALVELAKSLNIYCLKAPYFFQSTALQAKDKKWPAERASNVAAPLRRVGDEVDLKAGNFGRRHMRIIEIGKGSLDWELIDN